MFGRQRRYTEFRRGHQLPLFRPEHRGVKFLHAAGLSKSRKLPRRFEFQKSRISYLGMNEQQDLVDLWMIHSTPHNVSLVLFCFSEEDRTTLYELITAQNGPDPEPS